MNGIFGNLLNGKRKRSGWNVSFELDKILKPNCAKKQGDLFWMQANGLEVQRMHTT